MILYLLKSTLCTIVFLTLYKLLFEKEKMHYFKRYYLLLSLVASLIIPLLVFNTGTVNAALLPNLSETDFTIIESFPAGDAATSQATNAVNWPLMFTVAYFSIVAILLVRFILSLRSMATIIRNASESISQHDGTIVLLQQQIIPHSFFHYVFLNKDDYTSGNTEKEILLHEFVHVKQKHTWDVIMIQLLQILLWFNPALYYYRKAIQLNHEFLADEAVVKQCDNVSAYQYLLIDKAARQKSFSLTSQFNYSLTKKRLLMMTRITSKRNALLKQLTLIPIVTISIVFFSKDVVSQTIKPGPAQQPQKGEVEMKKTTVAPVVVGKKPPVVIFEKNVPFTTEGVSQQELAEYAAIVEKNKALYNNHVAYNGFSEEDKKQLESIYIKMTREQQASQRVRFISSPPPLAKVVPTAAQYEAFKNAKVYGVWINHKKVPNTELDKYTNADFSQVYISKLYGGAAKGKSYTHQLDLMTKEFYDEYYKTVQANSKSLLLISVKKS